MKMQMQQGPWHNSTMPLVRKLTGSMWIVCPSVKFCRVIAIPQPMEPRKWQLLGNRTINIFSGATILVSGESVAPEDAIHHRFFPIYNTTKRKDTGLVPQIIQFNKGSLWLRRVA